MGFPQHFPVTKGEICSAFALLLSQNVILQKIVGNPAVGFFFIYNGGLKPLRQEFSEVIYTFTSFFYDYSEVSSRGVILAQGCN